jgi:hypothetical protein
MFTAVHNSMADRMYVSDALNLGWTFIGTGPTQNELYCGAGVAKRCCRSLFRLLIRVERDYCLATDPLNTSPSETLIGIVGDSLDIGRDYLKLYRGATAI